METQLLANELRIGNLVQIKQELRVGLVPDVVTVDCIEDTPRIGIKETPPMWGYFAEEEIEPIPLTEEWLLKFGFEIKRKQYSLNVGNELFNYAIKEHFIIWKSGDSGYLKMRKDGDGWMIKECYERHDYIYKYVHQLQNLYFALTGEELQLNDHHNQ